MLTGDYYIIKESYDKLYVWSRREHIWFLIMYDSGVSAGTTSIGLHQLAEVYGKRITKEEYYKFVRILTIALRLGKKVSKLKKSDYYSLKEGEVFWKETASAFYINRKDSFRGKIVIDGFDFYYRETQESVVLYSDDRPNVTNVYKASWDKIYAIVMNFLEKIEKWEKECV